MFIINQLILTMVQTGLIIYFIFQIGTIKQGILKNTVMGMLVSGTLFISYTLGAIFVANTLVMMIMVLFTLFYDEENFLEQWKWIIGFSASLGIVVVIWSWIGNHLLVGSVVSICLVAHLWLASYRRFLKIRVSGWSIAIYTLYLYIMLNSSNDSIQGALLGLGIVTFLGFEQMVLGYNITFKRKTSEFQQELMANQYEEIKSVYLNMRGFRHDYHNHIQVIKAHLHTERIDLVEGYLLELEQELERIDSSVRSGNMMVDAILNSKMTVAEKYGIKLTCKAQVPEELPLTDIDLCVIVGNLLDNAIESCQKVGEGCFIRIYMAVIKEQLYMSIQNAAKEELDFNETHYISTKRGNHGLGMKRVKVLVDKYGGYLNLQNEPGIFASEITMPLQDKI